MDEQELWQPGARILVGVSGGPDSLCLLHLLSRIAPSQELQLQVAHLDHRLRPDSADDARFVAGIAHAWGLPCLLDARDVRALSRDYGGVEAAARAVRYGFLLETALSVEADVVAIGHHADDQAETVIQRLLRGAGPTGLAAMRPRLRFEQWRRIGRSDSAPSQPRGEGAPSLARPLLETTRGEIEAYCSAFELTPRYDPSNQSPDFLRNRVRGYIIPELKAYNSNIVRTLGRTARVCAEEDALLVELVEQRWARLATVMEDRIVLDREAFLEAHPALRRRILRHAVQQLTPVVELGAEHLDRMLRLVLQPRGRLQLPGALWMSVSTQALTLERRHGA